MIVFGPFQRGETAAWHAGVTGGAVADVSELPTAAIRRARFGQPTGAVLTMCSVMPASADGDVPAGWTVMLTDEQTLALGTGTFVCDLRCELGADTYISQKCFIRIVKEVTS